MQPSTLLRATMPFRPSSVSLLRYAGPSTSSILSTSSIRAASTSTTTPSSEQQPQQPFSIPSSQPELSQSSVRSYPYTVKTGTVLSVGQMDRTVRVAHRHTIYDSHIRKTYPKVTTYLVSDPRNSLREGDVIEFSSGAPKSRRVRHVVERIVAPFGSAIEERPAVLTREEREAERARKRAEKVERREQRRDQIEGDHVGRIRGLIQRRVQA